MCPYVTLKDTHKKKAIQANIYQKFKPEISKNLTMQW